ncbi:MAG: archaetidylserine decarboxylase [Gammaproteobacteria bacterium]
MSNTKLSFKEKLTIAPQYLYPHHLFSRLVGWLAGVGNESLKNKLIRHFGKRYKTNTKEAISRDLNHYPNLNSFYTRALKEDARPITNVENGIACPADGIVSQAGNISGGEIIQAKGSTFSVSALLGGESPLSKNFAKGVFATVVLSPGDYHRVHMPFAATLQQTVHIPGRLFSVNPNTLDLISELYAKNERVVSFFDSDAGPMAIVMVGSIFSASIETVWDGVITPPTHDEIRHWNYPYNPPSAKRGEEMGRFNMGSTVILLLANEKARWEDHFATGASVKMGQLIGKLI